MRKGMFCLLYSMKTGQRRWKIFVGKVCKMLFCFPVPHHFLYIIFLLTNIYQIFCLLMPNLIIMKIVSIFLYHIYSVDSRIVLKISMLTEACLHNSYFLANHTNQCYTFKLYIGSIHPNIWLLHWEQLHSYINISILSETSHLVKYKPNLM